METRPYCNNQLGNVKIITSLYSPACQELQSLETYDGNMDPSNQERQEEELQVLQAIYMGEFEDMRTKYQIEAGSPPIICLELTPNQSMVKHEVYAKADLVVKYTTRYPTDPPVIQLENPKGLSNEHLAKLKRDLDQQAKELAGEVMVLQLAQSVQTFLHKHNRPTLSFHEQMLKNMQKEKEIKEMEREKRLAKDRAQAKELNDEVHKRVQAALQEREARREERKKRHQMEDRHKDHADSENNITIGSSPTRRRKNTESSETSDEVEKSSDRRMSFSCTKLKQKVEIVNFSSKLDDRSIYCGKCVGHHFQGACTRAGLDLGSGEIVTVCEWVFKSKQDKRRASFSNGMDSDAIVKQVASMEQELSYLSSKLHHPNLIHYNSILVDHVNGTGIVRVLLDNIDGYPASECIVPAGLPLDTVQDYAKQIVNALNHLHNRSVVHKDLKPGNIFIYKQRSIKVCGYAVFRRLSDLHNQLHDDCIDAEEFADYRKHVKTGKKGDIFNLGLVVLSMLQGKMAMGYPVELPESLPSDAQDFLSKCLNVDGKERWSTSQLLKHPFLIVANSAKSNIALAESFNGLEEGDKALEDDNLLQALNELNIPNKTRLVTDFEILDSLGQGGFGSVIKVRKRLDGLLYAIKRINLNPKSAQLKKRIIREVKLLSRLNHENVVRYYSSWIEAEERTTEGSTTSDSLALSESMQRRKAAAENHRSELETTEENLLKYHDFDVPSMTKRIEEFSAFWGDDDINENSKNYDSVNESSSEDDDDDEDSDNFGDEMSLKTARSIASSSFRQKKSKATDSSDDVLFSVDESFFQIGEVSDSDDETDNELPMNLESSEEPSTEGSIIEQFLYIQMEYCEKSTLRNVIDEGLHKNPDRMWRLFREIVEGLAHVHSQGIIHRDLKPFNIFMDSRDQVKIGDFGLATSHSVGQTVDYSFGALSMTSDGKLSMDSSNRVTGKVGTALYVAPEIDKLGPKVKITEKVDLYSLGVIFFEMCYKPLPTGMERVKVLGLLRTEKIVMPEDFEDNVQLLHKKKKILLWLLNHNYEERPTASELLESGLVPPKLEDRNFDELLALTLKQASSTRYKHLTAALFGQNPDPVTDQIYDMHMEQKQEDILLAARVHDNIEERIRFIVTRHGACPLDIPLFMPKCRLFEQQAFITNVMDAEGTILSLPFDSRVSLARYISRNNIRNLKRFNIGYVYKDTKVSRTHPKEIKEWSFDIISDAPSHSLAADAEVLCVVDEVVKEYSCLRSRQFYVIVNHTSLLKAILMQASIDETQMNKVYSILQSYKDPKDCVQKIVDYLTNEGVPEHNISKMVSHLGYKGPVRQARETLQYLRKSRGAIGALAKQALSDLASFCDSAKAFGIEMPVVLKTCLAYNLSVFSGVIFQVVAEKKRKRKHGGIDILAGGGRYDTLVDSFRLPGEQWVLPRAVGVSIAFERIVNAVLEEINDSDSTSSCISHYDVLVGVMGETTLQERLGLVRDLWRNGIRATLSSYETQDDCTPESLQDMFKEHNVNYLVMQKPFEKDFIRVSSKEKDRFGEFRVPKQQLLEFLVQRIVPRSDAKEVDMTLSRVSSTTATQAVESHQLMNLTFILQDKSVKRRIESQAQSVLSNVITRSALKTPVEVVVVDLPPIAMRNLFAYLDIDAEEEEFRASVSDMIDKQKLKKIALYIQRICSTLREIKKERNVVMIYGYKEDFYRIFV